MDEQPIPGQQNIEGDKATAMLSLENTIKNHVDSIDKLKDEMKQVREMYQDSFNNNPTFKEHQDRVKEVAKSKASVRAEIAKQPSVANLGQKLKDIKFDIKEKQLTLSDLLLDYKEQFGATQLDLFGGEGVIVLTAKLVKKSKKFNN